MGIALDYRIRYYFAVTRPDDFVAARGAASLRMMGAGGGEGRTWTEFANALQDRPLGLEPVGRRLDADAEGRLCRACYALACYETLYRAEPRPDWPIVTAGRGGGIDDLLALASDPVVADLSQLSWAFYDSRSDLLGRPAVLNPSFGDVSAGLGGADADLIVDGCLIEIKASQDQAPKTTDPYQLLGYALADTSNRYRLDRVGFYYARRPALIQWPLSEYAAALAGHPVDLSSLRQEFAAIVGSLRRKPQSREPHEAEHLAAPPRRKRFDTNRLPQPRRGPGAHMPSVCPGCGTEGAMQFVEMGKSVLDSLTKRQLADYEAGTWGIALCGRCGDTFDYPA
ncbi:MAG: hypothetical protein WAO09_07400 [Candidatus Dormiibacterota bacterium]